MQILLHSTYTDVKTYTDVDIYCTLMLRHTLMLMYTDVKTYTDVDIYCTLMLRHTLMLTYTDDDVNKQQFPSLSFSYTWIPLTLGPIYNIVAVTCSSMGRLDK